MWVKLCRRLREARIAHADLQHGNVILVQGSRAGAYGLKLIDYDGMYLPTLLHMPSGEAGHPNFQHPTRVATGAYDACKNAGDKYTFRHLRATLRRFPSELPELIDGLRLPSDSGAKILEQAKETGKFVAQLEHEIAEFLRANP